MVNICDPTQVNEALWGRYQKLDIEFALICTILAIFWHQNSYHTTFLSQVMYNLTSHCLITLDMKYWVKPGLYSGIFTASGKCSDNFAAAFSIAAWMEDVGGFGVFQKLASNIDAEESEKVQIVELFRSPPRKALLLSNQLACLRSHDVPLLFGTFHESVWWKSPVPASWMRCLYW